MKVVVIGGTGLIGSKLIDQLRHLGHEAVAASPSTGVNTLTGEGLSEILKGARCVVDVSNSPSFEEKAALKFFETSTRTLLAAEKEAGVLHHVALSVVGTDLLSENGYFRAKLVQENLIKSSPLAYTIVRATQFFEFSSSIIESSAVGQQVHLPPVFFQPIASDDVATALREVILADPVNGTIEIAGPERFRFSEWGKSYLKEVGDPRTVISDAHARYFGAELTDTMLVPVKECRLGSMTFKTWLNARRQKI